MSLYAPDAEIEKSLTMETTDLIQTKNFESGASSGFMLNGNTGQIECNNLVANNATINGFLTSNDTPFQPIAMVNIGFNNSAITLYNNKNVANIIRVDKGAYTITLSNPVKLNTHEWAGSNYIDVFAIGNAHDTFDSGWMNMIIPSINWVRNYVDGRLTITNGYANVTYFTLYFAANNSDSMQDPRSAQIFIFGTETN